MECSLRHPKRKKPAPTHPSSNSIISLMSSGGQLVVRDPKVDQLSSQLQDLKHALELQKQTMELEKEHNAQLRAVEKEVQSLTIENAVTKAKLEMTDKINDSQKQMPAWWVG